VTPVNPYVSSWDWIAEGTPNGTGTLTFSSLPSGYQQWKVIGKTRTDGDSIGYTQINGANTNYAEFAYFGNTSTSGNNASTAGNAVNSSVFRRFAATASGTAGIGAPMYIDYFAANSTVTRKPMQLYSAYSDGSNSFSFTWANGQRYGGSDPISSITLATGNGPTPTGNFLTTTVYSIYGLKEGTAI
jgi:hypothetical protein